MFLRSWPAAGKVLLLAFLPLLFSAAGHSRSDQTPPILLANVYDEGIDISNYWVSEKYDGVRAYWNGRQFISRGGNVYHSPEWFTAGFPDFPLDGELWIARGKFQQLVSTVRKDQPIDREWQQVSYLVFELPGGQGSFTDRLTKLKQHFQTIDNRYIKLAEQIRVDDEKTLMLRLKKIMADGGEGLMLHRADALYKTGRSDDLLKLKTYQDAEATVVRHLPGKGKYTGLLGSLLVETETGLRFKIGSGLSDNERREPPPVGAVITYKYFGKTRLGKPRFASFLRIRSLGSYESKGLQPVNAAPQRVQ